MLALGGPLWADDRIETAAGPAVIRAEGLDLIRSLAGQDFSLEGAAYGFFADRIGNLVLLMLSQRGSACPAEFAWLNATPGQVALGERFGTRSDIYEVSHAAETVTVSMSSMEPGLGPVAFV